MRPENGLVHWIDWISDSAAKIAALSIGLSCFISAANAVVRYVLNYSSNGLLEIQWYLFSVGVMLGAPHVLRLNEHIRVDVVYGQFSGKRKAWIDIGGLLAVLLPFTIILFYFSWPLFAQSFLSGETSSNSGGLLRWPMLITLPLGFGLLILQALAEILKRIGWLRGDSQLNTQYERPVQ